MPAYGCAAPSVNGTRSGNTSNMIRKAVGIMDHPSFHTNVVTGPALLALSENVRGWRRRDCFSQLTDYLYGPACDRVCLLYGLRRTGKTTLLRQIGRASCRERECQYV